LSTSFTSTRGTQGRARKKKDPTSNGLGRLDPKNTRKESRTPLEKPHAKGGLRPLGEELDPNRKGLQPEKEEGEQEEVQEKNISESGQKG